MLELQKKYEGKYQEAKVGSNAKKRMNSCSFSPFQ